MKFYHNRHFNDFLDKKLSFGSDSGFEPIYIPDYLKDFQAYLVDYIIRKGRSALFTDCGTGKSPMELVWGDNVVRKTNKPVLHLTPLSVSYQMLEEAEKFGIEAIRANPKQNPIKIQVTNYEKLHYFDASKYSGVICDESSILKNFNGTRKAQITEFMRQIPYRLLGTATAAPNDWEELGTSSEALGYMGYMDMLSKFFTNKSHTVQTNKFRRTHRDDKFMLREYAKEHFWRWIASWARAARMPSDLGFDNNGFILPPLIENNILVNTKNTIEGFMFDRQATNFHEERVFTRETIKERCETAAEKISNYDISIAWCNLNPEGKLLKELIPDSVEISGSDSDEKKEEAVKWFVTGKEKKRRLISKVKIFGFGMNFQHCNHMTYFPTNSYEQYYQASRRLWRFGQDKDVIVDRIYTIGGERMLENLDRKAKMADKMFTELVKYMNDAMKFENTYEKREVKLPQWITK